MFDFVVCQLDCLHVTLNWCPSHLLSHDCRLIFHTFSHCTNSQYRFGYFKCWSCFPTEDTLYHVNNRYNKLWIIIVLKMIL